MTFKKKIVMGTWTSKQEEENQESSDDEETECDSMMLKTFYHIYTYLKTYLALCVFQSKKINWHVT